MLVSAAYRPPAAVLCAFVLTLFAALSWTLLFAYLLYGGLNIVTSIVAAMLIGLYVDYMILMYHRFNREIRGGRSPLQALETTFSETGKALISSSATSCVAFFSVVVTSFRGLHELGVVAGFGILFCLLSTFLVMGSLLSWLAKASPARIEAGRSGGVPTGWAERLVEGRSGTVVAVFSIFLFLSILGSARTRFDAGIEAIGPVDSKVEQVQRVIEEKFGRKGEPLFLVARADGDRRLAADFDALDLQGERWRRAGMVETFSSPATLVPPPRFQKESRRLLSDAGLPGRYDDAGLERAIRREMEAQGMVPGDGLAAYAAGIVHALAGDGVVDLSGFARSGDPRAAYFFNGSRNAIAAHLSPPGGRWGQGALAAMKEDVRALGPDFALTGPSLIFEEIRSSIVRESTLATFIAFAANWIIVWLHFRRLRDTALVMLPVTAGSLLTVGAMGAIGIPFNFFNVAGIALIFGFGVDYGIYYMQSRRESPAGGAAEALRRTGGGIALCALTTLASCGSHHPLSLPGAGVHRRRAVPRGGLLPSLDGPAAPFPDRCARAPANAEVRGGSSRTRNEAIGPACAIIPAYNAERTVGAVVRGALSFLPTVIVADDGSTDATARVAEDAGALVIRVPENRGKGHCLRLLFAEARKRGFDAVIALDSDGQHDPADIPRFLDAHRKDPGSVIVGSRMADEEGIPVHRKNSMLVARFYVCLAANRYIDDTQCGYRLYPLSVVESIALHKERYVMETELLLKVGDSGIPIRSLPIPAVYLPDQKTYFRSVPDVAAISVYVISYIMVKWALELWRPGEVNTYKGPGSGRDRFFLSPAMDRAFESLMVLTCMPLSALYGVLYFLMRSLFGIRVFEGLKGCGVPVGRVFLSTMLLPAAAGGFHRRPRREPRRPATGPHLPVRDEMVPESLEMTDRRERADRFQGMGYNIPMHTVLLEVTALWLPRRGVTSVSQACSRRRGWFNMSSMHTAC